MVMGTVVRHIAVDAPSVEVAEMEAMKEWKSLTGGEFNTCELVEMWEEIEKENDNGRTTT
tara:strand:- start:219 stop:398 length:180 start_codon:yes stop_codon:yes gene_type:complete